MMNCNDIFLRVPGGREHVLVIRTVLGSVALLKDFSVDALDDLRDAANEACDLLLNQGMTVDSFHMSVADCDDGVSVTIGADYQGEGSPLPADEVEICRAVLETLIPHVALEKLPCGCIGRVALTLPRVMM